MSFSWMLSLTEDLILKSLLMRFGWSGMFKSFPKHPQNQSLQPAIATTFRVNFLAKKKTADEAQDNAKKEDSELEDGEIVEDYPIKTDDLNKSGNWGDMED